MKYKERAALRIDRRATRRAFAAAYNSAPLLDKQAEMVRKEINVGHRYHHVAAAIRGVVNAGNRVAAERVGLLAKP